jgi:hypothetical protein
LFVVYAGKNRGGGNPRVSPEVAGLTVGIAGRQRRGSSSCEGFAWLRLVVGEAEAVPGDGVVEGVLRVLQLGSAMAMCSA